mmetsp:Transcript_45763/g.115198  ORF Transcript_45763/g.115198 Transcript_45763/m.115198 type:complete len:323 (+) Transcript_45763:186-1154(+)
MAATTNIPHHLLDGCSLKELQREFSELKAQTPKRSWFYSARLRCNQPKNRYMDVLPVEHTRVKLTPIQGQQGSDYINASYISSPFSDTVYIACQAPLPATLHDFWRMVWEQSSSVIVMLVKSTDRATEYWPSVGADCRYGNVMVSLRWKRLCGPIEIRQLQLESTNAEGAVEKRVVHHLLYPNWPDAGVPTQRKDIITLLVLTHFLQRKSLAADLFGPIVCHCSAGIGRTGTLIAIDFSLQQLSSQQAPSWKPEKLSVFETVCSIRRQRPGMVQTLVQYQFIYEVLADIVGHSPVSAGQSSEPLAPSVPDVYSQCLPCGGNG